jgi:hypothetical protein
MNKTVRKNYSKVRMLFDSHPSGLTINEACAMYKALYPGEVRDIAGYVCGQKNFANFKIVGVNANNESIYVSHSPSKEERIRAKMAAALKRASEAKVTYAKCEAKLQKLLKGQFVRTDDLWDMNPQ